MQRLQMLQPEDRAFDEEACGWLDEHLPPFVAAHRGSERDTDAYLQMLKDWQAEMASGRWVISRSRLHMKRALVCSSATWTS
jgi:hypothetical protein